MNGPQRTTAIPFFPSAEKRTAQSSHLSNVSLPRAMALLPLAPTNDDSSSSTSLLFDIDHHETVHDADRQVGEPSTSTQHDQQGEIDMVRRPTPPGSSGTSSKLRYEVPVLSAEEYALDNFDDGDERDGYGRSSSSKHGSSTSKNLTYSQSQQ